MKRNTRDAIRGALKVVHRENTAEAAALRSAATPARPKVGKSARRDTFTKLTVYVRKDTLRQVKKHPDSDLELSVLAQVLLDRWLGDEKFRRDVNAQAAKRSDV